MSLLITICARGGSKGIPGKNIRPLNGKPLIAYTIEVARAFGAKYGADIALSTDSIEIKRVAEGYGVGSDYVRPDMLANDTAGKIDAISDVLQYFERQCGKTYEYVLDLDVTSPLRTIEDLDAAFNELAGRPDALNIFSVNPANRNPYFNMVEVKQDGFVDVVKKIGEIKSRQAAPAVYDMNASFYFFRRAFFAEGWRTSITNRSLAYVMPHVCFDLDHPHDFIVMSIMLRENLLDFQL